MASVMRAVKLLDGRGEEWTFPIDLLEEAVRAGLATVCKDEGREVAEIERLEMDAQDHDFIRVRVTFRTSLMCLGSLKVR